MRMHPKKQNIENIPAASVRPFVSAVLVAAGNSTRMGGVNKQFLQLDGAPVLLRTVRAFEACALVDEIIIAAREQDIPQMAALLRGTGARKVREIVRGGDTRQESVFAAVERCDAQSEFLAIHDGARPLVTDRILTDTIQAAFQFGAAATGVRIKDTVKVVDENGVIVDTPDRSTLWAVHTPQVFAKEIYLRASREVPDSALFTDDCKLLEAAGVPVHMVEGSYENIKITTPEDIWIAEGILAGRKQP